MSIDAILSSKGPLLFCCDLSAIAEERRQLQLVPDQKRALFLAEKGRTDFVYNTAALEGNPFTYPEIQTLIDGITVGGHKVSDEEQVLNLNQALSYVMGLVKQGTFRLDEETACAIQGIVARNEALTWGKFRDGKVNIGGTDYAPPNAADRPGIFATGKKILSAEPDPIIRAFLVFLWGSLNQFFYDGNKRTSRFLANGTLLTAGFPPLMIFVKDQLTYNQVMTRFYDTQDATEALGWLYRYYREKITGFGFDQNV
ncbi:MAG: Fic family protein [Pseudomonadota bacterium]